ncbi:ABC transporter permease [Sphingomonas sp. AP4-R1]|uniref:ABC transporter permease n=1 Tax=Sphingomonas sp. AP4-R1 TaxID=2735134 RepID=UPI0014933162|nr:ABC transporter permease [Sphingomonas sp. AP4-R1]QJU60481.1 ABC transporter permease [Sphingomonas sp. AP4-R1]
MRLLLSLRAAGLTAWIGLALTTLVVAAALTSPWIFPGDPLRIVGPALEWPGQDPRFPLGTDALGRDMLAMIAHGARTTLIIGLAAAGTALVIGVTVGALAGYYDRGIGPLASRLIELFQTIPGLIFILAITAFLGARMQFIILSIGFVSWDPIARLTRAEFLAWRRRDFILACRSMGMGDGRIILGEILPNALGPIFAVFTLSVAGAILLESGLSFLQLSDPNVSTWGRLIGDGRGLIRTEWYVSALPGVAIVLTVVALSLISDAANDGLAARGKGQ